MAKSTANTKATGPADQLLVTWHGHSTWSIALGDYHLLIDPFLDDNPVAKTKAESINPTHILVSHGHYDHIADAASIAKRTGAQVLANFEIATWLSKHHGVKHTVGMNLGGAFSCGAGRFQLVPALHSSSLPDGSYGGTAGGWVLDLHVNETTSRRIYYAGDTALFSDMQWTARKPVDLLIVPIGDLFTMGVEDSIEATRFLHPKWVMPTHYDTWPPIAQDAVNWGERIRHETEASPIIPAIDASWTLPL